MPRGDLFPEIGPYETGYLPLTDGHVMYWEQVGNPRGRPVLFLHGGPARARARCTAASSTPPTGACVIFDQRGAGRSRPLGSLEANTTAHLTADIERLRAYLDIDRWLLFGGSWGSTLALAYAQAFPQHVVALVLRGVFLGRRSEVDWFLHGLRAVFPDAHAAFAGHLTPPERTDLLGSYLRRLTDPDPVIHMAAARAWSVYEGSPAARCCPAPDSVSSFAQDRTALGLARIEAFYFAHDLFLPPEGLLGRMDRIGHLPAEIVQGRYDMVCPPVTAFELAAAWPAARMTLVPDAGHSALEPGIRRSLVAAVERFRHPR